MDIEKGEEVHVKGIRNIFNKIHIRKIFKFRENEWPSRLVAEGILNFKQKIKKYVPRVILSLKH